MPLIDVRYLVLENNHAYHSGVDIYCYDLMVNCFVTEMQPSITTYLYYMYIMILFLFISEHHIFSVPFCYV